MCLGEEGQMVEYSDKGELKYLWVTAMQALKYFHVEKNKYSWSGSIHKGRNPKAAKVGFRKDFAGSLIQVLEVARFP